MKYAPEHPRIVEAYMRMAAEANYRPQAPGDGLGGIDLSREQLADPRRLQLEASAYASRFITEEDTCSYWIGVSNYSTNRALVYVIEAARQLCSGDDGTPYAEKLVRMALGEIRGAQAARPRASRSRDVSEVSK